MPNTVNLFDQTFHASAGKLTYVPSSDYENYIKQSPSGNYESGGYSPIHDTFQMRVTLKPDGEAASCFNIHVQPYRLGLLEHEDSSTAMANNKKVLKAVFETAAKSLDVNG